MRLVLVPLLLLITQHYSVQGDGTAIGLLRELSAHRSLKFAHPDTSQADAAPSRDLLPCAAGCTDRGNCDPTLGRCECPFGYTGEACATLALEACRLADGELLQLPLFVRDTIPLHDQEQARLSGSLGPLPCGCLVQYAAFTLSGELGKWLCVEVATPDLGRWLLDPDPGAWRIASWPEGADGAATLLSAMELPPPEVLPAARCPHSCHGTGWCLRDGEASDPDAAVGKCHCLGDLRRPEEEGGCGMAEPSASFSSFPKSGNPRPCWGRARTLPLQYGFCHCEPGYWGIDCAHGLDPSTGAPIVQLPRDGSFQQRRFDGDFASIADPDLRPRVYVYPLPPQYRKTLSFVAWMHDMFLSSPYRVADPWIADYYLLPSSEFMHHAMGLDMMMWARREMPFWNITRDELHSARHIAIQLYEHGPRDAWWVRAKPQELTEAGIPDDVNPVHPDKNWISYQLHGGIDFERSDGDCLSCYQRGKDLVFVMREDDIDGVLNGYTKEDLNRLSPFSASSKGFNYDRKYTFFFTGRIFDNRQVSEASGRTALLKFVGKPGWIIHSSMAGGEPVWTPEYASDSTFCYVPLGTFEGDPRRYLNAVLFGCIPVWYTWKTHDGMGRPWEEHPAVDWDRFSVSVSQEELPHLDEILEAISPATIRSMQDYMLETRVWERFLWSQEYGSYMGEDLLQRHDAHSTMMETLAHRL